MIVITAASGQLGRATAQSLARHVAPSTVRLAARDPSKLAAFSAEGFEVVRADYDDPASLRTAFEGAAKALVISGMGVDADRLRQHVAAVDAARAAGVKHVVYTSATHPTPDSRFEWAGAHRETEAYLKASGLAWTILRDNAYASNNDGLYAHALETGVFGLPGPDARVAWVTHEDVADALAAVLTGGGHEGRTYEITGPSAPTGHEVAAELARLRGAPVEAVDVPLEAFATHLAEAGLPPFVVSGVTSFYAALAAGEYAEVSGDVERLTGRPGTPLAAYLRARYAR
ncbi:SDR family oxidoreductase [Dokdonella sp. MW10]|uniref:SDR family oxidoreductase n=1 Tax=Dokdonella sp. MW10 TaxID=2992926 RepID=UPI003F7D7F45